MTQQNLGRFRRLGVVLAVPAISALALAGCGSGDDDDDSGDGGGGEAASSFTFAFGNASGQESPWQVLADNYSEATGVEVETKQLPPDSYGLTLRTQLQGGNAPDVMVLSPGTGQESSVVPLAEAGYLEPLTESSAALIPDGSEASFTYDDAVYAQPVDLTPVGMLWNPDAASEAGVEVPTDLDSLIESCASLSDAGKAFFAVAGSVPPNPGLMAMSISATRVYADTPDWNAQRTAGDVTFADSEGWQDTLQTVVDLNDAGCFQPGAAGAGFDAITQGMTQGTTVSTFAPSGAATELNNATPGLALEVQAFPPASGGKPFMLAGSNYALGVSAESDDATQQAALDFLAWVAEPENSAEFITVEGGVPITGPGDDLLPVYEPVKGLLEEGAYVPLPNSEWPNASVYDALATGVQGLIAGSGSVESVLEATDAAWDQ